MKANKIFSMITAAALAVSAFSAVTFTASAAAATLPINDASFTADNIPDYYSTTAAEEGKNLAVDNGYLKADRSDEVPAGNEFITIDLGSSQLKANDALSIGFTYTNGNYGFASTAQVYMVCGTAESLVGKTTALKGGPDGPTDFAGTALIPSDYETGDIKVVLKVDIKTNSPRIKNVKINKVERVTGIGAGVKTVNDDFTDYQRFGVEGAVVPNYYALKCTVDASAKLNLGYDSSNKNNLNVTSSANLADGDGIFVNMTGIEIGKEMSFSLDYGTGNGQTPAMVQLYEEIDGLLQSRVIAVSDGITGNTTIGTLSGKFTVPQYKESYRLLIAAYTNGKTFNGLRLRNLYINPYIGPGVTSVNDDYSKFNADDEVPSYLSLKYTTETDKEGSPNPPYLDIAYHMSSVPLLLVNGTNVKDGNGILVNMTGVRAGQTMNLSLKYGTGNGGTPAVIQLFEEIDGVIQKNNVIGESTGVCGSTQNDGSLNCTFNVSEYSKSYRLLIGAYTNGGNGINNMKLFNLYINPVQVIDAGDGTEVSGTEEYSTQTSTYYTTTITPDSQTYTTLNVSGTLKNEVNGKTSFSQDTAISTLTGESNYLIGIIIETTKDNINTLSVTLK